MSKTGTAYIDHVTDDGIAVLVIDYFPVNALSAGLLNGVRSVIRQLEGKDPGIDQKITGLVVMGAGDRAFFALAPILWPSIPNVGSRYLLTVQPLGRLVSPNSFQNIFLNTIPFH